MRKLLILVFALGIALSGCVAVGNPSRGIVEKPKEHSAEGEAGHAGGEGEAHSEGGAKATEEAHGEGEATKEAEGSHSEGSPTAEPTQEATPNSALPGVDGIVAAAYGRQPLRELTLFLGYIPNVQFAPVYVGIEQGFFRDAGIDLKIEHGFDETAGLTRIATDNLKFGMISGEQVLLARNQGAAVRYVYRWYQRFPVGIVSPASAPITKPEDLRGRVVGVPGRFGASYTGLQALLNAANLTEADLKEVRSIGFDTAPVVCERQVEASVIYIANEPAQIAAKCFEVNVLAISDFANIISNGIVTNEKTIREEPELVRAFVAAYDKALALTISDPDLAYQSSLPHVENLAENDPVQRAVLEKSIELWKAERLGESDDATWKRTAETLVKMGLLSSIDGYADAYTNDFLPPKEAKK